MAALKMLHQDWVESIQTRDQSPSSLHTQRLALHHDVNADIGQMITQLSMVCSCTWQSFPVRNHTLVPNSPARD